MTYNCLVNGAVLGLLFSHWLRKTDFIGINGIFLYQSSK